MLNWALTSCALICAVLLIRAVARGRAPARVIYALWLLAALRLLIPGGIGVQTGAPSVTGAIHNAPVVQLADRLEGAESITLTPEGEVEAYFPDEEAAPVVIAEHATERDFDLMSLLFAAKKLLFPLWLCGAAAVMLVFAGAWFKFSRSLRKSREPFELPDAPLGVYVSDSVDTPCLFGLVRPAIYLTREVAADRELTRHAVAHEYAHYRQLDHIWCLVRAACLALHWYNPLVWLAVRLNKRDCELACDEAAIRLLGERERADYGRSLIRLTCERARGAAVATTMSARPAELKERITMLTKKRRSMAALALALLLAIVATACSFAEPENTPAVTEGTGRIELVEKREPMVIYEFEAPDGAQQMSAVLYTRQDGQWKVTDRSHDTFDGAARFAVRTDLDEKTLSYGLEDDSTFFVMPMRSFGEGVDADTWSCSLLEDSVSVAAGEQIPLIMIQPVQGEEHISYSPEVFLDPDAGDVADGSVCLVIVFQDETAPQITTAPENTPQPTDPPESTVTNVSPTMIGFTVTAEEGETYEDVVSRWIHSYGEMLVRLEEDDYKAGCTSVSIERMELLGMKLATPETIVFRMTLGCVPRDGEGFAEFFGEPLLYGDPKEDSECGPVTLLDRYISLSLRDWYWSCEAVFTDESSALGWGSFSLEDRDDDFICELAESGVSAVELLPQVNYFQLHEADSDSWEALLYALDEAAVFKVNGDVFNSEQYIRDMYVMLAAENSDGAWAEWLDEILDTQLAAGEQEFETALETLQQLFPDSKFSLVTGEW